MTHGLLDDIAELGWATRDMSGGGSFVKKRRPVVGPQGRFRSAGDAAKALGRSPSTVYGWCCAGRNGWRFADECAR